MVKNKSVSNNKIPKNNVNNKTTLKKEFSICMNDGNWIKTIRNTKHNFTNKYKSDTEMAQELSFLMGKLIPDMHLNGDQMFHKQGIYFSRNTHCHSINGIKLDLINDLVQEIYSGKLDITSDAENKVIWQYSVGQGMRLICLFDTSLNTVYPLFVDPYHLIYPNTKHNKDDVMKYKLCPHDKFK